MILPNGTLQFKDKTTVGIDPATGYAVRPSDEAWADAIPCQILTDGLNILGRTQQGEPRSEQAYHVLLDGQVKVLGQLRLTTLAGVVIGEFGVRRWEHWPAVDQTSIWV